MFCLGAIVSGQGWATRVPAEVARRCGIAMAATIVVVPLIGFGIGVTNLSRDGAPFLGGWDWQDLILAVVEATLVVAGSIWLLAMAQRRLTSRPRSGIVPPMLRMRPTCLQVPVLIGLEIAVRPLLLSAAAKMATVAVLAVVACFALGWLIVDRTRPPHPLNSSNGMRRFLGA